MTGLPEPGHVTTGNGEPGHDKAHRDLAKRTGAFTAGERPGHRVGPVAYADHIGGSCQLSGRIRAAVNTPRSRPGTELLDRHGERAVVDGVLDQARAGRSAVLVVRGEPGIGKTA